MCITSYITYERSSKMKIKFTKEELTVAVKTSFTYVEVCRKLNMKKPNNYKTIKKYIVLYKIDDSHFLGVSHLKGKKIQHIKRKNILEFLTENNYINSRYLKTRLIKENFLIYKCDICNLETWNGNKIILELDHINGNNIDNRLENLRLLCPNCHSQTITYCRNSTVKKLAKICKICGTNVHKNSTTLICKNCRKGIPRKSKIIWPNYEELKLLVNELGYSKVGRKLNVSDNAIRKHLKKYET